MEVKQDHIEFSNVLTRIKLGRSLDDSGNDVVELQEETTLDDLTEAGAYE